jgi:hypothetical protein
MFDQNGSDFFLFIDPKDLGVVHGCFHHFKRYDLGSQLG